ncbi:hypothetical protein JK635_08125 [Neobacillus sp. YIM B02564]|uniref:Uncharacterized protein n=1 Tax=Neobacillus paridis TaxID=2803862 RepID=A0ABS1TLJ3_9BACI|nr:hypothetical protein [Neobacillus paridis]MBL4952178.1 hypothetical protein [Neobacillus paridis]
MICQSCHIKHNPEQPIPFYRYHGKVLCIRCAELESIAVITTENILGTPPNRFIAPVFKEMVLILPSQGVLAISHYMEGIKKQLLNQAKEQAIKEKGNAIVDANMQISRLEGMHFLVSFSGTIVWSEAWETSQNEDEPPIEIPTPQTELSVPESTPIPHLKVVQPTKEPVSEEEESVVGKYPDVGGNRQMNLFRKKISQD